MLKYIWKALLFINKMLNKLPWMALRLGGIVIIFSTTGYFKFQVGVGWLLSFLIYLVLAVAFILWCTYCTPHGRKWLKMIETQANLMRMKTDMKKKEMKK